eukprot:CAMPEP_0115423140 /NCGR_PEP_ID=MMETSP0271-20121206/27146_1 /TAXON_ID=71861 /ORGANISM="Scrippsiella trochoidea, Strain CCMP3099" /LENGTH=127 /DNA_ID=CAMNT_0002847869 /DNA_START=21 /DNA_END=407 /DNA_ORIENTATION=+
MAGSGAVTAGGASGRPSVFDLIDRNHDGVLSRQEWDKYAFDAFDQNHDSAVSHQDGSVDVRDLEHDIINEDTAGDKAGYDANIYEVSEGSGFGQQDQAVRGVAALSEKDGCRRCHLAEHTAKVYEVS